MRKVNTQYPISADKKDNPKLYARVGANGQDSLFLLYYFGYRRVYDEDKDRRVLRADKRKESLNLSIYSSPRTPVERAQNRETIELAKRIRFERAQQLLENTEGYRLKTNKKVDFLQFFADYVADYKKRDSRIMLSAYNRFADFLKETPEYNRLLRGCPVAKVDRDMILEFVDYLQSRSKGCGAKSIYQRFKKVVIYAAEHDILPKNPCKGIVIKVDDNILRKDILSQEEIERLFAVHYERQNKVIRSAFAVSLFCGLRFCDVKDLTYANIDYSNRLLTFEQNKTKGHSANSGVTIPLTENLLRLIGEPKEGQTKESKIFPLPSHTMCLKALRVWTKKANIDKHITWHSARHSFAVNILNNGANIKTIASLLGHSGLNMVEKYTRAVDRLKAEAIESLPNIDFEK